jgi:predicted ATPase
MRPLLRVEARNYGCLDHADVTLQPLSVLVGPNGSGKSTLLDTIQFLGDAARDDLGPAVARRGGFEAMRFRGAEYSKHIYLTIEAVVTRYASEKAPDKYELDMWGQTIEPGIVLARYESFTFKRRAGAGRRLTIDGAEVVDHDEAGKRIRSRKLLQEQSLALSTLPRLASEEGGEQVAQIADLFKRFRVFDVDVRAARAAVPAKPGRQKIALAQDASNLSAFLHQLSLDKALFRDLIEDARAMIPGFKKLHFRRLGGAREAVVAEIEESWLPGRTPLAAASFGTIRALAMLALLYDPDPPALTCVEEIDHGFHPHLFDRLVELMRQASERTQLLIATHSPALVNRLRPDELIVCERNPETGGVRMPAIDPDTIAKMMEAAGGDIGPGELWFSGSLGGVP